MIFFKKGLFFIASTAFAVAAGSDDLGDAGSSHAVSAVPARGVKDDVTTSYGQFVSAFRYAPAEEERTMRGINFAKSKGALEIKHFIDRAKNGSAALVTAFKEFCSETLNDKQKKVLDLMIISQSYGEYLEAIKPFQNDHFSLSLYNRQNTEPNISPFSDFFKNPVGFIKEYAMPHRLGVEILLSLKMECLLYGFLAENKLRILDSELMIAQCLRAANTPDAQYNYAVMIQYGQINVDFEGKSFKEGNRYKVAGALYRKSKTPHAQCNYAVMIQNGQINVDFEGKPFEEGNRYKVAGALYRESNTPHAQCNYASMIQNGEINVDFKGKPFEEGNRYEVAGALYRGAKAPNAQCNYAQMIGNGQINVDFEGNSFDKENRYKVAGALYRESKTPCNEYVYAQMIGNSQINVDFEGNSFDKENRYEFAAALHREAKIPYAKYNYALMLIKGEIQKTFDNKELLKFDDITSYLIDFIKNECPLFSRDFLLSYMKTTRIKTEEDYQEAERSSRVALASGQEGAEKLYALLNPESSDENESENKGVSDDSEEDDTDEMENGVVADELEEDDNEVLPTGEPDVTRKQQKRKDALVREEKRQAQTRKKKDALTRKFNAFNHQKDKEEKLKNIKLAGITSEDVNRYTAEFKCDIDEVKGSSQFQKLIEAILRRSNEGHPKILQGKKIIKALGLEGHNINHLFSRRLTEKDRIIYTYDHANRKAIVFKVEGHYDD